MHGIKQKSRYTESEMKQLMTNLVEATEYDIYSEWLSPRDFLSVEYGGLSPAVEMAAQNNTNFNCLNLTDGVDTYISCYRRRHREWKNGQLSVKLHLGADKKGDGTVFELQFGLIGVKQGDSFSVGSVPTTFYTVDCDMEDGWLKVVSPLVFFPITSEYDGILVVIARPGSDTGDTTSTDLYFYGAELMYHQDNRPVSAAKARRTTGV